MSKRLSKEQLDGIAAYATRAAADHYRTEGGSTETKPTDREDVRELMEDVHDRLARRFGYSGPRRTSSRS